MLKKFAEQVFECPILLDLRMDSKSLYDAAGTDSIPREVMLMSHVDSLRQSFSNRELNGLGHFNK